uniref:Uncharacterized protein n=1 Tax=viral metagenome TaxID=1070528 RepID=A0A6M3LA66_9ZZZZ
MISFEELCKARAKAGEKKYLVYSCNKCGTVSKELASMHNEWDLCPKCLSAKGIQSVNAALHRNSALDVAEELADAVNIAELWKGKLHDFPDDDVVYRRIQELQDFLRVWGTRCMMRGDLGKDDYPVKRIGFEESV